MNITLYTNLSDDMYVTKKLVRVTPMALECNVKDLKDVLTPTFVITGDSLGVDIAHVNYAYVDTFDRYYFAKVSVDTAGRLVVECNVDPLTSNATEIRMLRCVILRQEFIHNRYYQDDVLAKRVNRKYAYKILGSLPNAKTNILTVDGGK